MCDFGLSRFDTNSNLKTLSNLRGTYPLSIVVCTCSRDAGNMRDGGIARCGKWRHAGRRDCETRAVALCGWMDCEMREWRYADAALCGMRSYAGCGLMRDAAGGSVCARVLGDGCETTCGFRLFGFDKERYSYAAPEVYFGEKFTPKSDIFSIGMNRLVVCVCV